MRDEKMTQAVIRILAIFLLLFETQFAIGGNPAGGGGGTVGGEPGNGKQFRIKVPKDFDTIQEAINAAVDGDTIVVEKGIYREVLTIAGKRVNLIGDNRPMIYGQVPRTVGDAETASGLVNYIAGGGGIFKGFVLQGGNNGIVAYSRRTPAAEIEISDVQIRNTNRGVLAGWGGKIVLMKSLITNTAWHGILAKAIKLDVSEIVVIDTKGVGLLVKDTVEPCGYGATGDNSISNSLFMSNLQGGIVVFKSLVCVWDSTFYGNGKAGMRFVQSTAFVWNNLVEYTFPDVLAGNRWGDGIVVVPYQAGSYVELYNNDIRNSARAGLSNFGSEVKMTANRIQCSAYELEGEDISANEFGAGLPSLDLSFLFNDGGNNSCGCPVANDSCVAVSAGLAPPEPSVPTD